MATFDDNWQTKRPTITERTKFIFNNELLSDVKFVAPSSNIESESRKSQKSIPAHKFVLAISSPQGPRRGRGWGGFSPPTFLQE